MSDEHDRQGYILGLEHFTNVYLCEYMPKNDDDRPRAGGFGHAKNILEAVEQYHKIKANFNKLGAVLGADDVETVLKNKFKEFSEGKPSNQHETLTKLLNKITEFCDEGRKQAVHTIPQINQ